MSVAELIFEKTQVLPETAQKAVLELVEELSKRNRLSTLPAPKAGSAKGLIHISPGFDAPLEDFLPYMK